MLRECSSVSVAPPQRDAAPFEKRDESETDDESHHVSEHGAEQYAATRVI